MSRSRFLISTVLLSLLPLGLLFGAGFVYWQQTNGTPATATIVACDGGRHGQVCRGNWTGGVTGEGIVEGANPGDEGRTMEVRVSGGRAYTLSLRLPVILLVAALIFGAMVVYTTVGNARQARRH
ncbi:MAG: hypothetical protein ACRDT4_06040 [Micromonosporaceae bacterium]